MPWVVLVVDWRARLRAWGSFGGGVEDRVGHTGSFGGGLEESCHRRR